MGKCLAGILLCVAFLFGLNVIKGETLQGFSSGVSAVEQCTSYTNPDSLGVSDVECGVISKDDYFSFDDITARICEASVGVSSVSRGVGSSKNLKFNSAIKVLSSRNTPLFVRNTKNLYWHYCFVKSSCRYFVYTLERMLN